MILFALMTDNDNNVSLNKENYFDQILVVKMN